MKFNSLTLGAVLAGAVTAGSLIAAPAQAFFLYDEQVQGDLSNDSLNPTLINDINTSPSLPGGVLPSDASNAALDIDGSLGTNDLQDWAKVVLGGPGASTVSYAFTSAFQGGNLALEIFDGSKKCNEHSG
jgi:hypothetical protein